MASHVRDALSPYCSLDDVLTDFSSKWGTISSLAQGDSREDATL
jgi:hypothetical protein